MSVIQQFILLSLLPITFFAITVNNWLKRETRQINKGWLAALAVCTIWTMHLLLFFGNWDITISQIGKTTANYLLPLLSILLLYATTERIAYQKQFRPTLIISIILAFLPILFDRSIPLPVQLPSLPVSTDQLYRSINLTSWLLPIMFAWYWSRQQLVKRPASLYRNQLEYWLFALSLFIVGTAVAIIPTENKIGWFQLASILLILAATIGSKSYGRSKLTGLRAVRRQFIHRVASWTISFLLLSLTLWFITQTATGKNIISSGVGLISTSFLLSLFFLLVYPKIMGGIGHILWPQKEQKIHSVKEKDLAPTLGSPQKSGHLLLNIIDTYLQPTDAWLFLVDKREAESAWRLQPIVQLKPGYIKAVTLPLESPLLKSLEADEIPLLLEDINHLGLIDNLYPAERAVLASWQKQILMPMHVNRKLFALLAIGENKNGQAYQDTDLDHLEAFATQMTPLIYQAVQLSASNEQIGKLESELALREQENRYFQGIQSLYEQVIAILSPELRQEFGNVYQKTEQLERMNQGKLPFAKIKEPLGQLKGTMDGLVVVASRIEAQQPFSFLSVQLDVVVDTAVRELTPQAKARRITLKTETTGSLFTIYGDRLALTDAIKYIIHNAIKYNRIDGQVLIHSRSNEQGQQIEIKDNGIGISPDRLDTIWNRFTQVDKLKEYSHRGSGLGLPLARFIIEAHGGQINVATVYGEGSTFTLSFPPAKIL